MAFCNSCGTSLESGAKFCPKCGAVQSAAVTGTPTFAAPVAAPQPQSKSAITTILVVVAAMVVLGIIGLAAVAFVGLRIARHSKIDNDNGNVRIQSPLGNVESTTDPEKVAQNIGVDIYPGAHVLKGNAANFAAGGVRTVSAEFETDDPPDKVAAFYKSKFPNPMVSTTSGGNTSIVSTDDRNIVTINIGPQSGKTRIQISSVSGKGLTSGSGG
jgi:hypothetical protein